METSSPDTPEADPLKGQPEVPTLPPDLAWRLEASCEGVDTNLFFLMDQEELGIPKRDAKKMASLNEARLMGLKEEFCNHCPVVAECNESAILEGSHVWSLRGGLTPYEREGITPGKIEPDGIYRSNRDIEDQREYAKFLRGEPIGLGSERGKHVRQRVNKERAEGPQDALWEAHSIREGHGTIAVPAGSGWALSQDPTGTTLKVMYRSSRGALLSRYVFAKYASYDREGTPRVLMEGYPNGADMPKEAHGFWRNHNTSSKAGLAGPPRVWVD